MRCEPLDAPNDLRKHALSQLAFGQLQGEVLETLPATAIAQSTWATPRPPLTLF